MFQTKMETVSIRVKGTECLSGLNKVDYVIIIMLQLKRPTGCQAKRGVHATLKCTI